MNFFQKNWKEEKIFKIEKENFSQSFLSTLLEISSSPKKIYFKGNLKDFKGRKNTKFLAIIGSRNHSSYGKEALEKIISELKGYNIVIISGLALGIDSLAHQLSLKYKLKTIAIPGSGISDKALYPRSNFNLAEEILKNGGLLLSEFEPNFKATPWSFPQRNRIMAALADLVLVVEASKKSGTLITARLALEYNKDLGVIPASIFSDFSSGSNKLLKEGAHPIFSATDILELLNIELPKKPRQKEFNFSDFNEDEQKVLKLLREPLSKIELQEKSSFDITKLNTTLSILEIKGIIVEKLGKFKLK